MYDVEIQLRTLLGLPTTDGTLIRPATPPLESEFAFDWFESLQLAQSRRIETRKQHANIRKRDLELKAAHNLARPQVDLVGQYRRLADDPDEDSPLFSQALSGWQVGLEFQRPLGNRRESAGIRNAELKLRREHAVFHEQQQLLAAQLRSAFTELDRAFGVTQSLAVSRDAAAIRLRAESERHAAGETDIDSLLQAQNRQVEAATAYQRSLVDYNLAFIKVHFTRGTLLEMLGVGFSEYATGEEVLFAHTEPTVFATNEHRIRQASKVPVNAWPTADRDPPEGSHLSMPFQP